MPRERRDLAGNVIANKANWTHEEIMAWLDHKDKKDQDEYDRLQSEFTRNGNRHTLNTPREIWAAIEEELARESEQYIL